MQIVIQRNFSVHGLALPLILFSIGPALSGCSDEAVTEEGSPSGSSQPVISGYLGGWNPEVSAACSGLISGSLIGEELGENADGDLCEGFSWKLGDYHVFGYPNTANSGVYAPTAATSAMRICGPVTPDCPSNTPTVLQLAVNSGSLPLVLGPDAKPDPLPQNEGDHRCSDCGSSFTMAFVLSRKFSTAMSYQYLLMDSEGKNSLKAPVFGWESDTQIVFGAQGYASGNKITYTVPSTWDKVESSPLHLIFAVFSRTKGLKLWASFQKCSVTDPAMTVGANNAESNNLSQPYMGSPASSLNSRVDVAEAAFYDRALSSDELLKLAEYYDKRYSLGIGANAGIDTLCP